MKKQQSGFSLIEILIFVTILNLFFIIALAVTVFTLRNMQANEHKIIAVHYLDQLKEWMTYEKEKDWDSFYQKSGTYCFNSTTLSWSGVGSCPYTCPNVSCLDTAYNRQATLVQNGETVQVEMRIQWMEIDKTMVVNSSSVFSLWEK